MYSHQLVGPEVVGTVNLGTLLFTDPFRRQMSSLPLMGRVGEERQLTGNPFHDFPIKVFI